MKFLCKFCGKDVQNSISQNVTLRGWRAVDIGFDNQESLLTIEPDNYDAEADWHTAEEDGYNCGHCGNESWFIKDIVEVVREENDPPEVHENQTELNVKGIIV